MCCVRCDVYTTPTPTPTQLLQIIEHKGQEFFSGKYILCVLRWAVLVDYPYQQSVHQQSLRIHSLLREYGEDVYLLAHKNFDCDIQISISGCNCYFYLCLE